MAREAAETALATATRPNKAKSSFLANMSHELRSPPTPLSVTAEMLQEEARTSAAGSGADLDKIHGAGKNICWA